MSKSRPTKAERAIAEQVEAEMQAEQSERAARKAAVLAGPGGQAEWDRICEVERVEARNAYRASIQQYQEHVAEQEAHRAATQKRALAARSNLFPRPKRKTI